MFSKEYMTIALMEAQKAFAIGEVPVGAVLCDGQDRILAQSHNLCETERNITLHAEMLAIAKASEKLGNTRLTGCKLWVSLEPCPMCMAAIHHARIDYVYFGAYDPKSGGSFLHNHPNLHHKLEIYGGVMEQEAAQLMQDFFASRRKS